MAAAKDSTPTPAAAPINWTLISIFGIIAIVAIVGMVRPDRVELNHAKDTTGLTVEKYQSGGQK